MLEGRRKKKTPQLENIMNITNNARCRGSTPDSIHHRIQRLRQSDHYDDNGDVCGDRCVEMDWTGLAHPSTALSLVEKSDSPGRTGDKGIISRVRHMVELADPIWPQTRITALEMIVIMINKEFAWDSAFPRKLRNPSPDCSSKYIF